MKFDFSIASLHHITSKRFLFQVLVLFGIGLGLLNIAACDLKRSDSAGGTYVKPSITRTGKMRKSSSYLVNYGIHSYAIQ